MAEECLIAAPSPLDPVTHVRSTLIQSSLNSLRELELFDLYLKQLDPSYRDDILGSLAPEWLPVEMALAHYRACDDLELSPEEMHRIGQHVGDRIQGTFLGTLVRRARILGLNPWLPLNHFERLWSRLMTGGGIALYKVGPKDARIEVYRLPLARFPYFRHAFCGVISGGIKLGAGKAVTVKIEDATAFEERLVFHAMWV